MTNQDAVRLDIEDTIAIVTLNRPEALNEEDEHRAIMPTGEVAGRINDIPTVKELIDRIVYEAEEIIRNLPNKSIKE